MTRPPDKTLIEAEAQAVEQHKPLRQYRSQAEKTAVRQRNVQILLTATNVVVAGLTCLKVFGIL